jgi:hypothetical protein
MIPTVKEGLVFVNGSANIESEFVLLVERGGCSIETRASNEVLRRYSYTVPWIALVPLFNESW